MARSKQSRLIQPRLLRLAAGVFSDASAVAHDRPRGLVPGSANSHIRRLTERTGLAKRLLQAS